MKKINTLIGDMWVRNSWDEAVIKEVIDEHQYERWGSIMIKNGDTVVDLGAHIGSFTRLALFYGAKVIAVEPESDNFKVLKRNTEEFVNVKLINTLVYNGKEVPFYIDRERGELNKIVDEPNNNMCQSITLDYLVDFFNIDHIDLLKMDIEGAEYFVLKHFKALDRVKQLTIEWHNGAVELSKLIIFLEKKGLKTMWLGGNYGWGHLQLKKV